MIIELKKFGTTLISRQSGKEAFLAFQPVLKNIKKNEPVEVNFEGILTFSPSWGDEFLSPLHKRFGNKMLLKNTKNPSVKSVLEFLEEIHKIKFERK
tara:strand:- start:1560 stop:1850 length:291 start_codon:yes stop_codon:yes gene_type:complete